MVVDRKYVLCERLGAGGMGNVFLAAQPALARQVAIKVMHATLAADPGFVHRFRNEGVAASRVRHPSSVAIIDCGALPDGCPFMVMEYVPGQALGRVLAGEELELPRALALARQIVAIVAAVHASEVVHGDLKSDNFLLAPGDALKLIDFGLARFPGDGIESGEHADHSVVSGTPEYMAPELVAGGDSTFASDLYAVAVILYELLTGHVPFRGATADEVLARQLADTVVPPSVRAPDREIPAALDDVVLRALAKDPGQRFASANELALALAAIDLEQRAPISRRWLRAEGTGANATTRVNSPAPADDLAAIRRSIGRAMILGNVSVMADHYLQLARELVAAKNYQRAARELREGIDVLSAGSDVTPREARSLHVDRLVVALAALLDEIGHPRAARRTAAVTDRHPTLASR